MKNNPINKILGKDISKNREDVPRWWGKHQQHIQNKISVAETERNLPPLGLLKSKAKQKRIQREYEEERLDWINSQFPINK